MSCRTTTTTQLFVFVNHRRIHEKCEGGIEAVFERFSIYDHQRTAQRGSAAACTIINWRVAVSDTDWMLHIMGSQLLITHSSIWWVVIQLYSTKRLTTQIESQYVIDSFVFELEKFSGIFSNAVQIRSLSSIFCRIKCLNYGQSGMFLMEISFPI